MYLKRLEITGFKSFARKTTLEFEKGITAIVGPNGSGKSNSADAVRWVLGEQSAKMVRGKKSDDVIFAGSDTKGRLGFAEVSATFDNRDHKIPVDSAEVSIGRRIDRSGESEYMINGNKVRLLDIVDLVLKSNIGTSRYTVIGQGTIDQLILAGPSAIKDLLDEASGVKTYFMRREKTLKRLQQSVQNVMRAEDLISEIEPRLKSLRRIAKRMEARTQFEVELKDLQSKYYSYQFAYLSNQLHQVENQLRTVVDNRLAIEQRLSALMSETESKDNEKDQQHIYFEQLQTDLNNLQNQKNKLIEHISLLKGKVESLKRTGSSDPESLRAHIHSLNSKLEEEKVALAGLLKQEAEAKHNLSEATHKLAQLNSSLELLYKQLSEPHEVDVAIIVKNVQQLEADFQNFYSFLQTAEEIGVVREQATVFNRKFSDFRRVSAEIVTKPQTTIARVKEELAKLLEVKENTQKLAAVFSSEIAKCSASSEFAQKQIDQLDSQKRQLELELSRATGTDSEFMQDVEREESRLKVDLEKIEGATGHIQNELKKLQELQLSERKSQQANDQKIREEQANVSKLRDQESIVAIEKAKLDTHMETLMGEITTTLGENGLELIKTIQPIEDQSLFSRIEKLKHQLEMIGGVDDLTLQEHNETESRYTYLTSQVEDLKKGMDDLRHVLDELDQHIAATSAAAFNKVNEKFEYYFKILFNGGRAYLSQVKGDKDSIEENNETKPDEEPEQQTSLRAEEKMVQKYEKGGQAVVGVDIKATPPGKKLSNIQALSGGERALTSIALLCSLLTSFPSPFVFLDEVDAALDEANTMRFGQILGTLAHQTQFVTITHNRETMSQANTIYGVTMGDDGVSRLLSIKFDQAKSYAK